MPWKTAVARMPITVALVTRRISAVSSSVWRASRGDTRHAHCTTRAPSTSRKYSAMSMIAVDSTALLPEATISGRAS